MSFSNLLERKVLDHIFGAIFLISRKPYIWVYLHPLSRMTAQATQSQWVAAMHEW